jgi:hypothetical protein
MVTDILDLGMTVMAWRDDHIGACGLKLLKLGLAAGPAVLHKTGLKRTSASAAAVVVGLVGPDIYKVLFSGHLPYDKPQVLGDLISNALSH